MGGIWNVLSLEQLRKMTEKEISDEVNNRLAPAGPHGNQYFAKPADFLAVQFYMSELDRRENREANLARDKAEAKRRWIDRGLELLVVALIGIEICVAVSFGRQQSVQAQQELEVSGKMLAVLSDLQKSSQATAGTLEALKGTTESMSQNARKELELFYEPSLLVSPAHQNGTDVLEVHNNGRTSITIFAVKARNDVCTLEKPLTISSTVSGFLESSFVMDRTIRRVTSAGGSASLTIYFKTEMGQEFKHEGLVNRLPVIEGERVEVQYQNSEPMVWDRVVAKLSGGKC